MSGTFVEEDVRRIAVTTAVRDTDAIPKVPGAGEVRDHEGRRVQVMHNGVLVEEDCYGGAWTTEIIRRLRGHHEPQEELVFHAIVERLKGTPDPVMVELGSFWGYYSLWASRTLGARCVLVEPDPQRLEVGRRNAELNGADASFVRAAIGHHTAESGTHVPLVTIDGLLESERLDHVDILLCDIQGAELDALRAARRAIRERRLRFVVVSTHHFGISGDPLTHQRCLDLIEDAGGHVVAEHSVSESCSGDGLIAASFDRRDADMAVEVTVVRARDSFHGELEYDLAEAFRAMTWHGTLRRYGLELLRSPRRMVDRWRRRNAA